MGLTGPGVSCSSRQVAEMISLCRLAGLSVRDKVSCSDIQMELRIELLLLHIKRSQLRWFRPSIQPSIGDLPPCPTCRKSHGRPRTHWRGCIYHQAWEQDLEDLLRIPQEELDNGAGERDIWMPCLTCCHCDPTAVELQKMNEVWTMTKGEWI